jgi:nucleoside-triphosphatase THEP1
MDAERHLARVAAVVCDRGSDAADLFADAAARLRAAGLRAGGVVQRTADSGGTCAMLAENLGDGRQVAITQRLGPGSQSCKVDTAALAEIAGALGHAVAEARCDAVLVVKFGKLEAQGRGLRDELAAAIARDLPVVVAVSPKLMAAFAAFLGGEPARLPLDADAIAAWCLDRRPALSDMAAG